MEQPENISVVPSGIYDPSLSDSSQTFTHFLDYEDEDSPVESPEGMVIDSEDTNGPVSKKPKEDFEVTQVNFSPMSQKLVLTYPHIVENRRIIFEIDIMKKSSPNQLKSLSNLHFSQIFWLFLLCHT